ncbi:PREDICTED: transmembrane protein 209 [Bactrocera latifrons]|uniref:Transmembrane protein 209 n=1 Tax=Bactrocera latifrons TaxID=174628 RepID=A0A0K8VJR5_BACLA|nr:PREDICTED: transmembrane protein 209 [Bactrocera latifrons]
MQSLQKYCGSPNKLVELSLNMHLRAKLAKESLRWGCLNVVLLAILLFDISNRCPFAHSKWYYAEYIAAVLTGLGAFSSFLKYFLFIFRKNPILGTKEQKNLLKFDELDTSFLVTPPSQSKNKACDDLATNQINNTLLSWHSSFNDSRAGMSHNWSYSRTTPPRGSFSPQQQQQAHNTSWNSMGNRSLVMSGNNSAMINTNSLMESYQKYKREELITDEESLKNYLKEFSIHEQSMNETADVSQHYNTGSVNSFWNYCNTAANMLKTSIYQLSPLTNPATPSKQSATEDGGLKFMDSNSEVIRRISSEKLSQYVANLRRWMSATFLERLSKEIKAIDESFKNRGFADMRMGGISLERLKKTVENQQFVNQYMPMLPLILPFLEMSSNQEYLVQRIKDLAEGSCISDYRWNSGAAYHGLKWDEHLPTDSAILFHLFCVYMDSQLMPLPQGGGRPFFSRYVIMGKEKRSAKETLALVKNKAHCAILCTNPQKPRFNFISDKEIHTCAYDRNNLFYVIIQFLIHMKTHHEGALEGVNLGKSGINILCVIES